SLGGAAVLASASQIPEVRAVVTLCAPSDPSHVTGLFRQSLDAIQSQGEAEVQLAGRAFWVHRECLVDVATHRLAEKVAALRKALLVMHAPTDTTVDISNATSIYLAAKHPKSFISLDNPDHLRSRKNDAVYAATLIAAWSQRYL